MKEYLSMRYYKYILSAVFALLFSAAAEAQGDSIAEKRNALDYVLQKRPKREGFGDAKFKEHMFLSGTLGTSYLFSNGFGHAFDGSYYGLGGGIYLGKWFSPISGFRLGVSAQYTKNELMQRNVYIGTSLDYLLNLSALASGYNYDRVFELVGVVGADWMAGLNRSKNLDVFGGHIGLQAKFHVSPLVDIFLEPRLGIYTDNVDEITSWRKYNTNASLLAGFTYNMVPYEKRTSTSEFEKDFLSNTFITVSYGGISMLNSSFNLSNMFSKMRSTASVGLGKWFTPMSGFRLTGNVGYMKAPKGHLKMVGAQLDYLFNFNSAFQGFDDSRRFELIFVTGLNTTYSVEQGRRAFFPGYGIGLQGNLRMNKYNSIYIEPRLTFYNEDFSTTMSSRRGVDMMGSINLGFNFMRVPSSVFAQRGQRTFDNFAENMFFSLGASANSLLQYGLWGGYENIISPTVDFSIGKWFTSVSGLRMSFNVGYLKSNFDQSYKTTHGKFFHHMVGTNIDYMFNLTSALFGYQEDRIFDLSANAGLSLVALSCSERNLNVGANLSLKGTFNITPNWGIYIEPALRLYKDDFSYGYLGLPSMDGLAAISAGLNYKFGKYERSEWLGQYDAVNQKNFFAFYGGAGSIINSVTDGELGKWISFAGRFDYGRWFTPESAFKTGFVFDNYKVPGCDEHKFYALNLEYMLDMGALAYGYDDERVFTVLGSFGPSFGLSKDKSNSKFVFGLSGAMQAKFRLNRYLDFSVEPRVTMYTKQYAPYIGSGNKNHAIFSAALSGGLIYKF